MCVERLHFIITSSHLPSLTDEFSLSSRRNGELFVRVLETSRFVYLISQGQTSSSGISSVPSFAILTLRRLLTSIINRRWKDVFEPRRRVFEHTRAIALYKIIQKPTRPS